MMPRATSSLLLKISKETPHLLWAVYTSAQSPVQHRGASSYSEGTFLDLALAATEKSPALSSSHSPFRSFCTPMESSLSLQAEQFQLSLPVLTGDMLQSLCLHSSSLLDSGSSVSLSIVKSGRSCFLHLLATLLLMQPRVLLLLPSGVAGPWSA